MQTDTKKTFFSHSEPKNEDLNESSSMVSARSRFLFKLVITLFLLAYLGLKIDWNQLDIIISSIKLLPFVSSYLILLLCSIPLAIRLRILLEPTELRFSLGRLIEIQFISQFYSLLLPSGVGMSIARWYQITKNQVGRRVFIVITLIERAMLTMTLLLCTGIPLLLSKSETVQPIRSSLLLPIFLLILCCLLFFSLFLHPWIYGKFSLITKWLSARFNSNLMGRIFGVYKDCGLYLKKRHLLIKAFFFHLCYQGLTFIRFYFIFVTLDVNLTPLTVLWISMLVMLVLTIPFSLGGIGIREAGFSWLLVLYGIEPERGFLLGGIISIQVFLNIGLGAIMNMKGTKSSL